MNDDDNKKELISILKQKMKLYLYARRSQVCRGCIQFEKCDVANLKRILNDRDPEHIEILSNKYHQGEAFEICHSR